MKKIFLSILLILVSLNASILDDANAAYYSANYKKAHNLYSKACDNQNMTACNNLGIMYFYGDGVKVNKQKALKYYSKACISNHFSACNTLGLLYDTGNGVEKNKEIASKFYIKACQGGNKTACNNYKRLKEKGFE